MPAIALLRHLVLCLFLFSATMFVFSQDKEAVLFNAAWLKYEEQSYMLEHTTYSIIGGDTSELERLILKAVVIVQDSTADRFILEWHFQDFSIQSSHYPSVWMMQQLGELTLRCKTSQHGVLREFLLLEEFRKNMDKAVETAFASYQGLPSESSRERVYALREELEVFLLSAIHHFHQAYGLGYVPGELVEVPVKMETRFSEKAMDAVILKKLDSYDPTSGVAGLVMATQLDTAQLNQAMQQYLAKQDIKLPRYSQENTSALVMHLPSGWILYGFDKREVFEGKSLYGEFFEITHQQK